MSEHDSWLASLKAGDVVFVSPRYAGVDYPRKVLRTTPTMIVVADGTNMANEVIEARFQRKSGRSISGDTWTRSYIFPDTPERREKWEMSRLSNKVCEMLRRVRIPNTRPGFEALISALAPFQPKEAAK